MKQLKLITNIKSKIQDIQNNKTLIKYSPRYTLNEKAYEVYRLSTNKNKDITYEEATLKLNRNTYLAEEKEYMKESKRHIIYYYGKLLIKVNRITNEIVYVNNDVHALTNFQKNEKLYKKINRAYKLENDNCKSK